MFEIGEFIQILRTAMAAFSKAKFVCPVTGCMNLKKADLDGEVGGCYNLFIFFFTSPSVPFCDGGKFTAALPKYRNFRAKE